MLALVGSSKNVLPLFVLKVFLAQLVCNLLDEGNATFREGSWRRAVGHYSEGISVANYAKEEALSIPIALLESLYLNRAAANYSLVRNHLEDKNDCSELSCDDGLCDL